MRVSLASVLVPVRKRAGIWGTDGIVSRWAVEGSVLLHRVFRLLVVPVALLLLLCSAVVVAPAIVARAATLLLRVISKSIASKNSSSEDDDISRYLCASTIIYFRLQSSDGWEKHPDSYGSDYMLAYSAVNRGLAQGLASQVQI